MSDRPTGDDSSEHERDALKITEQRSIRVDLPSGGYVILSVDVDWSKASAEDREFVEVMLDAILADPNGHDHV